MAGTQELLRNPDFDDFVIIGVLVAENYANFPPKPGQEIPQTLDDRGFQFLGHGALSDPN